MGTRIRPRRRNADARLDAVRWRPPLRGNLIRLLAVTALLVVAAAAVWARPTGCTSGPVASGSPGPVASGAPGTTHPSGETNPSGETPPSGAPKPSMPPDSLGVPVRLAEPAALRLLHPGDRVDLVSVDEHAGTSARVAAAALVLGVTGADDPTAGGLLLALTPPEAAKAVATPGHGFAVFLRPA